MNLPKPDQKAVTVFMLTYNQERYVRAAIESVLMQRTTFPVSLYIADDCSTDDTQKICVEYQKQHPELINLRINPENLGLAENATALLKRCMESGAEYIAMLEGDDYWTDPLKLQKQFDMMERMPEVSLCFHQCSVLQQETGSESLSNTKEEKSRSGVLDVIERNTFIRTCSIFLRISLFEVPDWFLKVASMGDCAIQLISASKGDVYYIPDNMATYRRHSQGVTNTIFEMGSKLRLVSMQADKLFMHFNRHTRGKYSRHIWLKRLHFRRRIVDEYAYLMQEVSPFSADYWKGYWKILRYSSFKNPLHLKYLIRYLIPVNLGRLSDKTAA